MVIKAGTLGLFQVDIVGAGTPFVQSLTSHVCAVAAAHNRSPTALLRVIGRHAGMSFAPMSGHLAGTDGSIINGYGALQTQVLTALSRASGRCDLMQTCLGQLSPVFASKGGRAVKVHRHWCARCYAQLRVRGVDAHDLLLSQIADLQICPDHLVALQSKCGDCGAHQLTLPTNCKLDICGKCGAWLGSFPVAELDADLESAAYQKWLVHELAQLLRSRDEVAPLLTGREESKFLRELIAVRRLTQEQVATKANIPLDTLRQWILCRNKPTIASWLRACANLGISPASVFLDPELAAHQLPFPFASPTIYKPTRDAPRKQHSQDLIRKAIADQLARTEPPFHGIKELARKLEIPVGILYFHDPDGCKLLTRKLRRQRSVERANKRASLARSAQRVLARMDREKQLLTRRVFVPRLMAKSKCSVWIAKDLFPIALQKYLSRDG